MADKELKSISFPGLNDLYLIPPGSNVAPEYSPSSTYAVGDLRTHNGKLYQCNTTISTAEAWNSSHWTQVSLSDVMDTALDGKVDKEAGKGLSTEDYTTEEKTKLGALPTNADLETALGSKLDKRTGSGVEVYTHDGATQGGKSVTETPTAGAVPLYGTGGVLKAGAPTADNDVARKAEIDAVKGNIDAITIIDSVSGAIASFPDGADSLPMKVVADINPVQDLHGQDAPYPAGGVDNKFPNIETQEKNGITLTNNNGVITLNGTATDICRFDADLLTPIPSGSTIGLSMFNSSELTGTAIFLGDADFSNNSQLGASTANSAQVFSNISYAGEKVRIRITSGTTLSNAVIKPMLTIGNTLPSTFAPYSNECPISGHTECEIWDDPAYGGFINWNQIFKGASGGGNGLTLTVDTSTEKLTISGTASANTYVKQGNIPKSIIGHKYFASIGTSNDNIQFYNDSGGVLVKGSNPSAIGTATGEKDWYCRFANGAVFGAGVSFTPQLIDLTQMFGAGNEPSTVDEFKVLFPKAYYAYDSGTVTCVSAVNGDPYRHSEIDFPVAAGTVYGAKIQVNEDGTGVLTVDRAIRRFSGDGDEWNIGIGSGTDCNRATIVLNDAKTGSNNEIVSDTFKTEIRSATKLYCGYVNNNKTLLLGVPTTITNRSDMNSWATLNPFEVVYLLNTPVTYNLTAEQTGGTLRSLYGQNNVWNDCNGDTTVQYPADTKLYIDKKITEAIANALL